MKRSRLAQIAVSAAVVCAIGAATAAAEQQAQPPCTLPVAKVAGERTVAVYDAPGGESRIGYLAPGDKYFVAETRSLSVRNAWHMLIAPGGAFVGWVRAWDGLNVLETLCPRALPPIEFPLEGLYRKSNR
jgi:anti-sigma-K factor RskA